MHVNTFFGRSVEFNNGFHLGFNWVHGNGRTSKTSAVIAGYHPPSSITWLWALYWGKPAGWKPSAGRLFHGCYVRLPLVGALELRWQSAMPRKTHNAALTGAEGVRVEGTVRGENPGKDEQ